VSEQVGPVDGSAHGTRSSIQEDQEKKHTESSGNTNDQGISRTNLGGEVDFCTRVSLGKLNAWDRVSNLNHGCECMGK